MRSLLFLCLLFLVANGEKKINLDDIERDNLRSEIKTKPESVRPEETNYSGKPNFNQQQYQIPLNQYNSPSVPADTFVPPQQIQNEQEDYSQSNKYSVNDVPYQQQENLPPEQNVQPQYYGGYHQQTEPLKNVYEPQQLLYQPEVVVGNKIQSVQQKAAAEKYTKNVNRETPYVDTPTNHLLSYYPNLDINSLLGKTAQSLFTQYIPEAPRQLSIPIYNPLLSQKQLISPVKASYQIQYAPKYASPLPATFAKLKGSIYPTPVTSKRLVSTPFLMTPVYVQPDQSLAQGRKFLYTQAYFTQPTYFPQLVYTQPGTVYMSTTPIYTDPYTRASASAYVQDNSLHGQVNRYNAQPQQQYVSQEVSQLPKQVVQQDVTHSVSQNYAKVPAEPNTDFVPPQLPAENFKSDVTQLVPVPPEEVESLAPLPSQDQDGSPEPRSLLDTYIPSKLIAAQDSDRYKERPLKLETGFIPSKVNFIHKKRKIE